MAINHIVLSDLKCLELGSSLCGRIFYRLCYEVLSLFTPDVIKLR
jgi:hypothetical protein